MWVAAAPTNPASTPHKPPAMPIDISAGSVRSDEVGGHSLEGDEYWVLTTPLHDLQGNPYLIEPVHMGTGVLGVGVFHG